MAHFGALQRACSPSRSALAYGHRRLPCGFSVGLQRPSAPVQSGWRSGPEAGRQTTDWFIVQYLIYIYICTCTAAWVEAPDFCIVHRHCLHRPAFFASCSRVGVLRLGLGARLMSLGCFMRRPVSGSIGRLPFPSSSIQGSITLSFK